MAKGPGSKGNEKRLHFSIKQGKIPGGRKGKFRNKPVKSRPQDIKRAAELKQYAKDHYKRGRAQGL